MKNKMGGVAWAHVGYHYGMFQVANVGDFTANLARLPSESCVRRSMTTLRRPLAARSSASTRPTGPAPTITTGWRAAAR